MWMHLQGVPSNRTGAKLFFQSLTSHVAAAPHMLQTPPALLLGLRQDAHQAARMRPCVSPMMICCRVEQTLVTI
jgi:hypothetical protein